MNLHKTVHNVKVGENQYSLQNEKKKIVIAYVSTPIAVKSLNYFWYNQLPSEVA